MTKIIFSQFQLLKNCKKYSSPTRLKNECDAIIKLVEKPKPFKHYWTCDSHCQLRQTFMRHDSERRILQEGRLFDSCLPLSCIGKVIWIPTNSRLRKISVDGAIFRVRVLCLRWRHTRKRARVKEGLRLDHVVSRTFSKWERNASDPHYSVFEP